MYNFIDNSIKYYPYTTYEYHKGDTILYTINPIVTAKLNYTVFAR